MTLDEQLESLAGPLSRFSEHKRGEAITYRMGTKIRTGVILWIAAPHHEGSTHIPLTYLVESGQGWPDLVWQTDLVEEPGGETRLPHGDMR
jgi:hypothetical protein